MIRTLGSPNFFMTLSCAECYWPELLVVLKKTLDKEDISLEEAEGLSMQARMRLIRRDPITCARYFEHRMHAAFNFLIKPSSGIFGHKVTDFYLRTEFQHRGSPHVHMLLWIEGAPKIDVEDQESVERVTHYIDKLLCCEKDNVDVIHQDHHHTHTCKPKSGTGTCRFNFPLPPMKKTQILFPLSKNYPKQSRDRRRQLFGEIQKFLEDRVGSLDTMVFEDVLSKFKLTDEEYLDILRSTIRRPTVFLRRRPVDVFTNCYNKDLATAWKSNMDLQLIFDPFGAAHYVCSYISKSTGGISKLMREMNAHMNNISATVKEKMRALGNVFLNNVEVSCQEAAYGILGLPLTNASRDCMFIQTAPPEERIFLVKSELELQNLDAESTEIAVSGLLDHYVQRPNELEETCLAEFAAWYTFSSKQRERNQLQSEDVSEADALTVEEITSNRTPYHSLKDKSGYVKKRQRARVIRYRRYGQLEDYYNYCREQLMLFIPWRNETEILEADVEAVYESHYESVRSKRQMYNFLEHELEEVDLEDVDEVNTEACIDEEYKCLDGHQAQVDLLKDLTRDNDNTQTSTRIPLVGILPFYQYKDLVEKLNSKQLGFLDHVLRKIEAEETFKYFVYGGAGVGKSTLIESIVQTVLRRRLSVPGTSVDSCKVLLMAPTGMSAHNIKGTTLHSALKLPLTQFPGEVKNLSMSDRNTFAYMLRDCQLIIVDEISMVSCVQLNLISRRLQQIFGSSADFGGKPVILFGDLRQFPPVEAPPIYAQINGMENTLWESFETYELTEIMRQKDDLKFAQALNNLARGVLTEEEIAMFRSREVSKIGYPKEKCRRIYYQNSKVNEYNEQTLSNLESFKIRAVAIDVVQGFGTTKAKEKLLNLVAAKPTKETSALPTSLLLVEKAQYMLTRNLDTSDGLCNGAVGCLERVTCGIKSDGNKIPKIAWLKFDRIDVGRKRRKFYQHLKLREGADSEWTPILIERVAVRCWKSSALTCVRGQFPLIPAEGTTVHKAQGSTLDLLVVNVEGLRRKALYVALSRARTLNGLYLEGEFKPKPITSGDRTEFIIESLKSREIDINMEQNSVTSILESVFSGEFVTKEEFKPEVYMHDATNTSDTLELISTTNTPNVISIGEFNIYTEDMDSLRPGMLITDSIVDGFIAKLARSYPRRLFHFPAPTVRVIMDFDDEVNLEVYTAAKTCELIVLPYCDNVHWVLAVATPADMKINLYNSMQSYSHTLLGEKLQLKFSEAEESIGGMDRWKVESNTKFVPQQEYGSNDCGAFLCYFVECLCKSVEFQDLNATLYRDAIKQRLIVQ